MLDLNGVINTYHAEFLKWNNPPFIYGTFHYHFSGYQDENLVGIEPAQTEQILVGKAIITFGVGRIGVKNTQMLCVKLYYNTFYHFF